MPSYRIEHYRTPNGIDAFGDWFDGLRDVPTQQRVLARIDRLAVGLFGDTKLLRDGVHELRIDAGPGYRIYYALSGRAVVLLCAGTKRTQRKDIARAISYWRDFRETS